MKLLKYLVLVCLSLIVACGKPPTVGIPDSTPPIVTLEAAPVVLTALGVTTLTVAAVDLESGIAKVVFSEVKTTGNEILSEDTTAPFTLDVTFTEFTTRNFLVTAFNRNEQTLTAKASIAVTATTEVPTTPVVTLVATPDRVIVGSPITKITLKAKAEAIGGIKQVQFFALDATGFISLGTDFDAPFELITSAGSQVGFQSFKAVATHKLNANLTGEGITTITRVAEKPFTADVLFGLAIPGEIGFVAGHTLRFNFNILDEFGQSVGSPETGVQKVEWFQNPDTLIGSKTSAPFEILHSLPIQGTGMTTRTYRVRITSNAGQVVESAPKGIQVTN